MGGIHHRLKVSAVSWKRPARVRTVFLILFLTLLLVALGIALQEITVSRAAGTLTVEIISAYNLVVDSNVGSPSTYAPRVATVIGKFCNNGDEALTNVYGYIGDYDSVTPANSTPGIYPVYDSDTATTYAYLNNTGDYYYRHVGAASDASRYIGDIPVGECRYQYWTLEYPACENVGGAWREPPCASGTDPLWGPSVKPDDDFKLSFDIWGTSDQSNANASRTMTMRNEISAMANKIEPNGNPPGRWFNTISDTVRVGEVITTNGILYSLGNVRFGFDNDGDYAPDYNAWVQPISQADFDPSCFRLIRTSGVLTVTRGGGNPDMIIHFTDQLYFTDLPADNTNVRGEVYYTYLALDGPCNVGLSPYQEVASGFDNEKFNGDYGTGIPPVVSLEPEVTIDKSSAPDTIVAGSATTYTIPFANTGGGSAGLTLSSSGINMPLVISDTVPNGMQYVSGSATYSINGGITATIRYSTDSGATWSTTDPGTTTSTWPDGKVIIQWWLNEPLPAGSTGNYARYRAQVPSSGYTGSNIIENTACVGLGDAEPFDCDTAITIIDAGGAIGDFVWRDEDNNGQQTGELTYGIDGVTVSLYWDKNGDGELDDGDVLLTTQDTYTYSSNPGYYQFTNLPADDFLVVADGSDVQVLYPGYRLTTPALYAVTLASGGSFQTADFGYGPSLEMEKSMLSAGGTCDGYEGREVVYSISLANKRPGTGETVVGGCRYPIWSSTGSTANPPKNFTDDYRAYGAPDDSYAYGDFSIGSNRWIQGTGFDPGGASGTISTVEVVFRIYVDPAPPDDYAVAELYQSGVTDPLTDTIFTNAQLKNFVGQANAGYITWTLPSSVAPGGSWDWSDFALLTLYFAPEKTGSADASNIYIDAIGFRVTASGTCPAIDDDDIMTTVPLTDTYDTTYLEFVSASPAHTAVNTTTGVITWTNVGPIYPGETRNVYVHFLAKPIAGTSSVTVNNSAGSTGTKFADGGSANDVYDTASGSICQAGSINGYVYSDPNGSGWNYSPGAGDLPIPGVQVTLYGCYHTQGDYEGELITLARSHNSVCTSAQNNGAWQQVATQVTDASGYYAFNGLFDGFYYVQVTTATLPGTVSQTAEADDDQSASGTLPDTTADGGGDSNSIWGDPTTGKLGTTEFNPIDSAGETINGVNFGYTINAGAYGSVWEDNNGDGDKDDGEGPIGSVDVGLYTGSCGGTFVMSTTTDADGSYWFGDLTAGTTYYIAVYTDTLPGGASAWTQTGENDGSINNCISFTAVAGTLSGSHDFGFRNVGSYTVGDTLYYDWNGDGTQQTNEEGIPNITVSLYEDSNGNGVIDVGEDAIIMTATTTITGFYQFANLPADSYLVVVDTIDPDFPAAVVQTQDPDEDPGVCETCDNRGKADTTSGSVDDIDFGYQPKGIGAIGDTVWRDMNGDGSQAGPQETGISNITVWLEVDLNGDGTYSRVLTDTTDADGKYLFEDLPDGSYRVVVDTSDSDIPTGPGGFTYVPSTATTQSATISGGNTYLDADFGFTPLAVVGDMVYYDANTSGDQDLNETGIPGVEVRLYNATGVTVTVGGVEIAPSGYISTTTSDGTDGNPVGWYQFAGLETGSATNPFTYTVQVMAGSLTQTADPDRDGVPCGVSDPNYSACDNQTTVLVYPGTIFLGADFGYQATSVIGDYVWYDGDGDGVQDDGEVGIAGLIITATNGTSTYTTTTDFDGGYIFTNLPDDKWTITVGDYDDGTSFALTPTISSTNAITSGVGSMGGMSVDVTLSGSVVTEIDLDRDGSADVTSAQCGCNLDLNIDFGFRQTGDRTISGHVFFDAGGSTDTLTDTIAITDTPYANITIYLWKDGMIIGQTTTDASGAYTFTNVAADSGYTVSVDRAGRLSLMEITASPNAGYSYNTVDTTSGNVTDQDFGFYVNMDMGDLPESYNFGSGDVDTFYNTPLASEGPIHVNSSVAVSPTIYLGTVWDAEADGAPNADAGVGGTNGDDGASSDDEDGITFSNTWYRGETALLSVTITDNDPQYDPYLVGWFDWNQDGKFDTSEMITFGDLSAGTHEVGVPVPSSASLGRIYMRFRLYATQSPPPVISPIGAVTNGEVEDYWETNNNPTAVTLSLFQAEWNEGAVLVAWETAMEIDTVGFNLWRSTSSGGRYEQVNSALIPAASLGGVWGGSYSFTDSDVSAGTVYYYKLEELEVGGRRNWYGPVSTGGDDPTSVTFFNVAASDSALNAWWAVGALAVVSLPLGVLVHLRKRRG